MALPPFTLDIYNHDDAQLATLSVTDAAEQLTFSNIIGALQYYLPDTPIHAFKYVDDERDFITVRTDKETADMIKAFVTSNFDRSTGAINGALVIYPSNDSRQEPCGMNARIRPDLHVEVSPTSSLSSNHSAGIQAQQSASPLNINLGSAASLGSHSNSPDAVNLSNIMNGPLSADTDPLTQDQFEFDPIADRLGAGSGGAVFKTRHIPTNSLIALKTIGLDTTSTDPEIQKQVQKQIISELSILHRCKSPFIISFWGAFFHGHEINIATEYMDGGSLDRYKPIEEPVLGRMSVMVVHGLQYLWSIGIMHRDVKPSNMLVNTTGIVKLCDFGVSRQLINSTAMTYCGTHAYMSPERLSDNKGYKIQSDLWSLGVSLFEMAVGNHPFPSEALSSPVPLFNSIVEGRISSLPRSAFSANMCLFVNQCLKRAPDQRPHPRTLISHPFIAMYNDGDTGIVADYVKHRLPAIH